MNEMKMLLWKDYRLSRICLIAGAMLLAAPYIIMFINAILRQIFLVNISSDYFSEAWMFSAMISQFTMALLAGNIIAGERADRSAEFLAFQGASRTMLVASKLITCILVFAIICTINIIISLWIIPSDNFGKASDLLIQSIIVGIYFFGSCWFFSSFPLSPVAATVFGTIVPYLVLCTPVVIAYLFGLVDDKKNYSTLVFSVLIGVGITLLIAGTWRYLRSKES
jgi:ABC-type transport system involved in multi-copper enzyme maturation permease subunit